MSYFNFTHPSYTKSILLLIGFLVVSLSPVLAQQPTDLNLTGTVTSGSERLIRATNTITASNYTVQADAAVVLEAGQTITLEPGFSTEGLTSFEASIEFMGVNDSGYTLGEFTVDEAGGSAYNIPITLSPGTAGMEPQIALTYNSHSGDGLIGAGWSLAGFSSITRIPSTVAQDGTRDIVDYDASDRFGLDGERLIVVSGGYGNHNSQYHTEQHSFSKIISYGSVGSGSKAGPEKFIVYTKSGLIMEYGYTADSRVEAVDRTDVMTWAINKISDTKGNYMTFSYYENTNSGEHYPLRIDYTGNTNANPDLTPYASVRFEYTNRSNTHFKYLAGAMYYNNKRLSRIKSYYKENLVREYKLAYQVFDHSKPNYSPNLRQVEECVSNGTCFDPTTFIYNNWNTALETSSSGFASRASGHGVQDSRHLSGDFDNDGRTDVMYHRGGTKEYWFLGGTYWGTRTHDLHPVQTHLTGDFDGDGTTDVLYVRKNTTDLQVMRKPDGGAFSDQKWATMSSYGFQVATDMWVADINHDGRSDVIIGESGNVQYYTIAVSTGSGFVEQTWGSNASNINDPTLPTVPMDIDGDGTIEIVYATSYNGPDQFWARRQGQSDILLGERLYDPEFNSFWPMDVNNDGLTDLVYRRKNSASYRTLINTGDGFTDTAWGNASGQYPVGFSGKHWPLDVNGDGFTDLVYNHNGTTDYYVLMNNGRSFLQSYWGSRAHNVGFSGLHMVTDTNGDGKAELTYNRSGTGIYRQLRTKVPNRLLTQITNGHGLTTSINYNTLSGQFSSIYTRGNSASYPQIDIQPSLNVVSSYSKPNGVGGLFSMSYKYFEAISDLQGRGFRGFKRIDQIDDTHPLEELEQRTYYTQDFRYGSSRIEKKEQYANGTLVSRTTNTPALIDYSNGAYFSYVDLINTTRWDLNGAVISSSIEEYDYDSYGNATRVKVQHGADYVETVNTFTNNTTNWHLGRLTQSLVTHFKYLGQNTGTQRKSTFTYDPISGMLTQEILEPDDSQLKLTKNYTHDVFGNVTQSQTIGWNGITTETRATTSTYDERGRFVLTNTNPMGYAETQTYDNMLGNRLTLTGPNGLTTRWRFDPFGRLISNKGPDGNQSTISYQMCTDAFCTANNIAYKITTTMPGEADQVNYYDLLDRAIITQGTGLDGTLIYTKTVYDLKGRVLKASDPYFAGTSEANIEYTQFAYDILGREISETAPGNRVSTITYNGKTISTTNPLGQTTTKNYDSKGDLSSVVDNEGNSLLYLYDDFGNIKRILELSLPNTTEFVSIVYDKLGNKTQVDEANVGTTTFNYNGFGELITQTDSKSQSITHTYDKIGRIKTRTEPEGTTTWTYDNGFMAIGKLTSISGPNGQSENYTFDALGRPSSSTVNDNGNLYTTTTEYDEFSRVVKVTYPSGFAVNRVYNAYGHHVQVRRDSDNFIFWKANSSNARGQLLQQTLGNGKIINQTFDNQKHTLNTVSVSGVQNMSFIFNDIGNLIQRRDLLNNHTENFGYDGINRLTSSAVVGGSSVVLTYDSYGNITYKSDVGCYEYGQNGAGINALTSIKDSNGNVIRSYTYDANGNRITSTGGSVSYTSFNKPLVVNQGSYSMHYNYGPNHNRRSMVTKLSGNVVRTRRYINGIYEEEIEGSTTRKVHYINSPGGPIATYTTSNTAADETRYLHKDHLGSVVAITNESGVVTENISYDAWGQRRNPNWTASTSIVYSDHNRGFTGHEQLEEVKLVHMNGRVYDPEVGRFLNPDPVMQSSDYTQNVNRYTYVYNNPLSLTDPTGYISEGVKEILSLGIGALTGGIAGQIFKKGLTHVIASAAGFGFGQASSSVLLNNGSLGKAFERGLVAAAVRGLSAYAVNHVGSNKYIASKGIAYKAYIHGTIQGATTAVMGGKFEHGFLSGYVGSMFGDLAKMGNVPKVVVAAVTGGAVSSLNGGKFANGAMSSSFVVLFNHVAHQRQRGQNQESGFPSFDELWDKFPNLTAPEVYKLIGGKVWTNYKNNPSAFANACTLRMCVAMNDSGYDVPYKRGETGSGKVDEGGGKKWYYYRVRDFASFVQRTLGEPDIVGLKPEDFKGFKGIILFEISGWGNASGHFDLWNGSRAAYSSYFNPEDVKVKSVKLWKLN